MSRILAACVAIALAAASARAQSFYLLVTESPAGNTPMENWGGVRLYEIAESAGEAVELAGIPSDQVSDPAGLAINPSMELFVGNRHGNTLGGSVSRFIFDVETATFIASGTITGNSLFGVHDIAFNPVNKELFAANVFGPVSRFTFVAACSSTANGTIASGLTRGVAVSATGDRLYVTTASNVISRFDLSTGNVMPAIFVPGGTSLHFIQWGPEGDLYAADIAADVIYRYAFDVNQEPTYIGSIGPIDGAIDVDFSPDGLEMFVSTHPDGEIHRLAYDVEGDTWVPDQVIEVGESLGALTVFVPAEVEVCEGDANGDGTVDPLDSGFVQSRFGCTVGAGDPCCDSSDQNGDGVVDPLDVGFVLSRLGECS